ncbi:hypothetical protein [Acidipropionibacterium timonense]|uniref:hypothetical protein n=1 Tax=Acidipropionibacterium timonense TaxID=2161818 RepID=UPI00315A74DE
MSQSYPTQSQPWSAFPEPTGAPLIADDPSGILTLPPLEPTAGFDPEGIPRRPGTAVAATACFAAASVASAVGLALAWWGSIHMRTFSSATHLMTWTHPRPGSLASVLLVTLMTAIGMAMTAMPGILAVNTWFARRWVRWGAIGGIGTAALAVTLGWSAWIGAPFAVAGLVLVWLPTSRRWFERWVGIRVARGPVPYQPRPVRYGPVRQHL